MKTLFFIVSLFIFLFALSSQALTNNQLIIKGTLPEGVKISHSKVVLKPGYTFQKVSKNKVNVMRMRGGTGITGSFDCTCNGADGGCSLVTTPNSVTCVTSGCKSGCYMITTIPNPSPMMMRQ